jgi:hypothetical protein
MTVATTVATLAGNEARGAFGEGTPSVFNNEDSPITPARRTPAHSKSPQYCHAGNMPLPRRVRRSLLHRLPPVEGMLGMNSQARKISTATPPRRSPYTSLIARGETADTVYFLLMALSRACYLTAPASPTMDYAIVGSTQDRPNRFTRRAPNSLASLIFPIFTRKKTRDPKGLRIRSFRRDH